MLTHSNFKNRFVFNLRTKVILIFLILILIPLSIIGAFSLKATERLIFDMVMRQLDNVAVDKTTILERWLGERESDLQVISGTSILKSMDQGLIAPYIDLIQNKYLVYKAFTVISANGDIIYSTCKGIKDDRPGNLKTFPIRDHQVLSGIAYDEKEKESVFNISVPILNSRSDIIGALYGTIGTNQIILSILNVSLGKTGECYLVDKNGTFLAHKDPGRILHENISQSESFENIFNKTDLKKTYLDYRGIEVLGTSQKIKSTGWRLVVEQDRDEAFQGLDRLKFIILITILLCLASAFMLIWFISSHIVNPIRALSQSADILANAEFEKAMVRMDRQDEIGMLCRAFGNMTLRLQERQKNLTHEVHLRDAELKETDNMLRQAKLIAARSQRFAAIGHMVAAVAHEIRTPLTSLKLFLESVHSEIEISTEYQEDMLVAMKEIKRIETTINRFLEFSKPQELIITDIDISQLLEDILSIIRPMINKNECALDVKTEEALQEIKGDKKLLGEALINILINALEAMPSHGKITIIAAKDLLVQDNESQPCIRIDIMDTGPGIPGHLIVKIFDPFFTTRPSGTGLGLSIATKTIKSHGGLISVKSEINKGTVFSLFLPLKFNPRTFEENGQDIAY